MSGVEFFFSKIGALIQAAAFKRVLLTGEKLAIQTRVRSQINDCVAEVADSLAPFFADEKLSEAQQILITETCVRELAPLLDDPRKLLSGAPSTNSPKPSASPSSSSATSTPEPPAAASRRRALYTATPAPASSRA